ncbi:hypothetical protein RTP6_002720 [Batrachochytrium dendrobatidis]
MLSLLSAAISVPLSSMGSLHRRSPEPVWKGFNLDTGAVTGAPKLDIIKRSVDPNIYRRSPEPVWKGFNLDTGTVTGAPKLDIIKRSVDPNIYRRSPEPEWIGLSYSSQRQARLTKRSPGLGKQGFKNGLMMTGGMIFFGNKINPTGTGVGSSPGSRNSTDTSTNGNSTANTKGKSK